MLSQYTDRYLTGKIDSTKKSTQVLDFWKNYERLQEVSAQLHILKEITKIVGTGKSKVDYLLYDSLDAVCQCILNWIDLEYDG
tara:strand:+ start:172 stop:420 length:249 start_codon:yes stop_codon:yes gene_type:complete